MLHHAEHRFYEALLESREPSGSNRKNAGRKLRKLAGANRLFLKLAEQCPENFQLRSLLLEAEVAAVARRFDRASDFWHRAGRQSGDLQQWHLHAIAWRRLADHAGSEERVAYLQRAADAYRMWGASRLAASLESTLGDHSNQSG
jgi:hypothetical protein